MSTTSTPRGPLPAPTRLAASSGTAGVIECYRGPFHHIVFRGAGLAGYNEGRYADNPSRLHAEAHRLQNKKIIEHALYGCEGGTWTGTRRPRILDVGCGNGELLEVAASMGVDSVGITLVPEQIEECTRRGVTAYKLNYLDIGPEWDSQFDGVVLKGSIEHFVQPRDVVAGHDAEIYRGLFATLARVLDPRSESGRVANSTIQFLRRPDPNDLMKNPLRHAWGSDAYHFAWLHQMYNGWHPCPGELEKYAESDFSLEKEENISEDYFLSAEYCLSVIKRAAWSPRMWREVMLSLAEFPKSTLVHAWGLYVAQSTNWYFRGPRPPTEGVLQTWKRRPGVLPPQV